MRRVELSHTDFWFGGFDISLEPAASFSRLWISEEIELLEIDHI
jgi:hypothetical protein